MVNRNNISTKFTTAQDNYLAVLTPIAITQNNLRKRVSAVLYADNPTSTTISAMYYNYDISGNVKTLYRQIPGLGTKQIDYQYDLISGKVNFVAYQHNATTPNRDQFYYLYKYDADNRLTEAWSSPLATVKPYGVGSYLDFARRRLDAAYFYYLHGPLARLELGDQLTKVQGQDYAYTLQGWLKGVNGNVLNSAEEIGKDGTNIAKDALAFGLNYYANDYKPIGTNTAFKFRFDAGATQFENLIGGNSLYNGNISSTTLALAGLNNGTPVAYTHRYDQLNRLKQTLMFSLTPTTTTWGNYTTAMANYREALTYDANGNIKTLLRNGGIANKLGMDNLIYTYYGGKNQLNFVTDLVNTNNYTQDIKNTSNFNYQYNKIGNLTKDVSAGINTINWTVYGKINKISYLFETAKNITYTYDPAGNRQSKAVGSSNTYYVRDAQGNTLATYEGNTWAEQHLYGSSRLGIWKPEINMANASPTSTDKWRFAGLKQYELTNHLGNVLTTISDKRKLVAGVYEPDVLTAQDYYPGGMPQPGRRFPLDGSKSYRFGFNGKENDNEVKGAGNQQDYGMRIYDTRLNRFLSVDPISKDYPELTPYQFASNTPIQAIDLDGLEALRYYTPQQAIYKYGEGIAYAVASMIDKLSTKIEATIIPFDKITSRVTIENKNTAIAKASFSTTNSLNYIRSNNTSMGMPSAINISAKVRSTLAVVTKSEIGPVTIQSENIFWSSDGLLGTKVKSFFSTIIDGIPTDIGGSVSISSSGEKIKSAEVTLKPLPNLSVPMSVSRITPSNGSNRTEVKAGAEVKLENDKVGIKGSTSVSIGIND